MQSPQHWSKRLLVGCSVTVCCLLVLQAPQASGKSTRLGGSEDKKTCSSPFDLGIPSLGVSAADDKDSFATGELLKVYCWKGYYLTLNGVRQHDKQMKRIQCQRDGLWAPLPACNPLSRFEKCEQDFLQKYVMENGSYVITVDDKVHNLGCNGSWKVFKHSGSHFAEAKCSENGVWVRPDGGSLDCRSLKVCDREDAEKMLGLPQDGSTDIVIGPIIGDKNLFQAELSCENRKMFKSKSQSWKMACYDGQWKWVDNLQPVMLKCEAICTLPPNTFIATLFEDGNPVDMPVNRMSHMFAGQQATVKCLPGYRTSGFTQADHGIEMTCPQGGGRATLVDKSNSLEQVKLEKFCNLTTGCTNPFHRSVSTIVAKNNGKKPYGDRYEFQDTVNGQCYGKHRDLKLKNDVFAVTCRKKNESFEWDMNLENQLKCAPEQCTLFKVDNGRLQVKKNGNLEDLDPGEKMVDHGKSVFVKCNAEFTPSNFEGDKLGGLPKITCNGTTWATAIPACVSTDCPAYYLPNGEMRKSASDYRASPAIGPGKHGVSFYAHCDKGFKLSGDQKIECQKGVWTTSKEKGFPSCNPAACQGFHIPNGYAVKRGDKDTNIYGPVMAGERVSVKCNPGYKTLSGDIDIQCNQSESSPRKTYWSGEAPACVSTKCSKYTLAHGHLELVDTSGSGAGKSAKIQDTAFPVAEGTKVKVVCDAPNFGLTGRSHMECVKGTWVPKGDRLPSCGVKNCSAPYEVPHAEFEKENEIKIKSNFEKGSEVYLICKDDFWPFPRIESNRVKLTCNGDGTWGNQEGFKYCRSTSCSAFSVPNGALDENPEMLDPDGMYKAGAIVNVTCEKGYILETSGAGTNSVHCDGKTQEWTGPIPSCSRVPPVPHIGHGTVDKARIRGGKGLVDPRVRPKITCDSGFRLKGSNQLQFSEKTQSWEPVSGGSHPYCEASPVWVVWPIMFLILLLLNLIVIAWFGFAIRKKPEKLEFLKKSTPFFGDGEGKSGDQKPPTPSAPNEKDKNGANVKKPDSQNAKKPKKEPEASTKSGQGVGNVRPVEVNRGTSAPRSLSRKRDRKGDAEYKDVSPRPDPKPKVGEVQKSTPISTGEGGAAPNPVKPLKSSPKEGGTNRESVPRRT